MISYFLISLQTNKPLPPKATRVFLKSAAIMLAVSAMAKLVSATGSARILEEDDPIFLFSFRKVFWLIGSLELVIALIYFFGRRYWVSVLLTAWIAACFVVYRLVLWWVGWHHPCACLGNLTDAIHVSPQSTDTAMKIILAYLLIGSCAALFWLWRQKCKVALTDSSSEKAINLTS